MRCARRAGRSESVKLADVRSCDVVSGGRPCLILCKGRVSACLLSGVEIGRARHSLYQVRESKRMQWQACYSRNVAIGDSSRRQISLSWASEEGTGSSTCGTWTTLSNEL